MIKKWHSLIEAYVQAKTSDGYIVRMFAIAFTKKTNRQVKATCYAQASKKKLIRQKNDGDVMVGCGTILTTEDAEKAVDAGSEFIITPVMLPDVIEWCAERNIVCVPGCQTPTELVTAYRHGAPLQKLFPGVAGGPGWVKAVSSALPFLSINPTSGVDLDNAGEFLKNGAASVGLVAPLFDQEAIAKGDFDQIAKNAEKVMANVRPVGPYVRK